LRLLITGASGLLGHKIRALAESQGHQALGIYNLHEVTGNGMMKRDLTDASAASSLISETKPDVVINTASFTDVDRCESEFETASAVNGRMPGILAKTCAQCGAMMLHVSTDYVFDGQRGNYKESDPPHPINRYGRSKLEGEIQVARNARDYCIARTSAVYGWGRSHRQNFATWMLNKWRQHEEVKAVTDQFVSPTLNINLAQMLLEVAERRITGTIHLSGSTRMSRHEFAMMLARKFNFDEALVMAATSVSLGWLALRPRDSSLDVSKASHELGNKPFPIEAALDKFYEETIV